MTLDSGRLNKKLLGFLFFFIISLSSDIIASGGYADAEPALPVPKGIKNELFYLQRDPNKNTVIYELNLKMSFFISKEIQIKILLFMN
jgi:hypothetical protein